jgi:hypothetical protein
MGGKKQSIVRADVLLKYLLKSMAYDMHCIILRALQRESGYQLLQRQAGSEFGKSECASLTEESVQVATN